MFKLNNKSILLGLGILAISAFGLIAFTPIETKAYDYYQPPYRVEDLIPVNTTPQISSIFPSYVDGLKDKTTITITGSGFTQNSVVRKNNIDLRTTFIDAGHLMIDVYSNDLYNLEYFFITVFNSESGGKYSNAAVFNIKNNPTLVKNNTVTTTSSNTTTNSNTVNSTTTNDNTSNTVSTNNNVNGRSMAANVLIGSDTFLPSGLGQWIVFIIVILLIIFLWRYINSSEKTYKAEPMKHA